MVNHKYLNKFKRLTSKSYRGIRDVADRLREMLTFDKDQTQEKKENKRSS